MTTRKGTPPTLVRFGPRLFLRLLAVVFVAEFAVMLFLDWLNVPWSLGEALLDPVLLTLLIALPLSFLVLRPAAVLAAGALLNEHYRDLINDSNDLIQSVGTDGRFLLVNRRWSETLGYTEEEARRMHFTDILRPDQVAHCESVFAGLQRGEALPFVETVFVSKAGREIEVEGSVSSQLSEEGFLATRGYFRDVTGLKRLQLLEAILPICSLCGKIRDDNGAEPGKGSWSLLKEYVQRHSNTKFSHGFCPECYRAYRVQQGLSAEPPSKPGS